MEKILALLNDQSHEGELFPSPLVFTAEAGARARGQVVQLSIQLQDQTILACRCKVQGCPYTIAAAKYVAARIEGLTLAEAQQVQSQEIIDALDFPSHKQYSAVLAYDGLQTLIRDAMGALNHD